MVRRQQNIDIWLMKNLMNDLKNMKRKEACWGEWEKKKTSDLE